MKKRYAILLLISGLVLMNACLKEHSQESGAGPSAGSLQDDGTGDCFPKTVSGVYVVGTALTTSNYIDVQVNVTTAGVYTIYTDTVNGIHFRGSGVFSTTGSNTVRLTGFGTPTAVGIANFIVVYGTSVCTVAVTIVGSLATFTLDGAPGACMSANVAGTYTAGTALDASNTVTINVTVTTAGAYNISTTVSNGMTFSGSGTLALGAQTIVLIGAGTPTTAGSTNVPVTVGGSSCSFPITVGGTGPAATYTINCAAAVINGTYTQNTALTASNTIIVTVDVATAGTYTITGTINGMTFSKSGTFASAGTGQSVTLAGTGTPTTSGANVVPLTGGTANCNVTVNVTPAAGAAVFTFVCASAVVNGTYTQSTALTASNTITVNVDVTTAGTYTITGTVNGMTFSKSGTFAVGTGQLVTLAGTGTPTTAGANIVSLTGATTNCDVTVTVNPAGGGAAVFTINCASAPTANGTYTQNVALSASNTATVSVNVTTIGTYSISTTTLNGMTFSSAPGASFTSTGIQNVTLTGSGTPTAGGMFNISIPSATCTFLVYVGPGASATDYFPRVTNDTWSYEFDDDATDSSITKVIAATHTALGNAYNIFMSNTGGGFDTSGYYRKSGNDYYRYTDLSTYLGLDNIQRVEFIFIKDNQAAGFQWTTPAWTNSAGGTPLSIRIHFTLTQKDVPISITTSTGTITYQNVLVIEEHYEANLGTGFISLDTILGYFKDYYARGVGWIKDEFIDEMGANAGTLELRRYIVY